MFKLGKSTSQMARLTSNSRIDQKRKISFTFDGTSYSGYAGDTLASAPTGKWRASCWSLVQISPATGHFISRFRRTKCTDQIGQRCLCRTKSSGHTN